MLSLTDEMTTAVRSMNRGTSDIDFNFGMTINQAPPAPVAPGLQPLGESQGIGDGGNATASAEAGSAWFAWCEAAPCMESHNCTGESTPRHSFLISRAHALSSPPFPHV